MFVYSPSRPDSEDEETCIFLTSLALAKHTILMANQIGCDLFDIDDNIVEKSEVKLVELLNERHSIYLGENQTLGMASQLDPKKCDTDCNLEKLLHSNALTIDGVLTVDFNIKNTELIKEFILETNVAQKRSLLKEKGDTVLLYCPSINQTFTLKELNSVSCDIKYNLILSI